MKNSILLIIFLIIVSLVPAKSQKYTGGAGGLNLGSIHIDPSGFNQFLPDGNPQFSGDFLTIGGDGYFMLNNLIIGGSGHGIIGEQLRYNQQIASLGGGMGFFQMGYDFLHKKNLKLYPLVGIGGGGVTMVFSTLGSVSKTDIVQGNTNGNFYQTDIGWGSVMFDLGIGFDFFPETEGGSSPRMGLRAGYQFSASKADFTYAGGPIDGASSFSLNGYYFKIIIGGGGFEVSE